MSQIGVLKFRYAKDLQVATISSARIEKFRKRLRSKPLKQKSIETSGLSVDPPVLGEWTSECVNEWISVWMSEWISEWISEWVSEWVIEGISPCAHECVCNEIITSNNLSPCQQSSVCIGYCVFVYTLKAMIHTLNQHTQSHTRIEWYAWNFC